MSPMKHRLIEDRTMRDAARAVVDGDVAFLKAEVAEQGLGSRVIATGMDYAQVLAEGAVDLANDHRGKVSGGLGLVVLGLAGWIYRDRLGELFGGLVDGLLPGDDDDMDTSTDDNSQER